MVLMHTRSNDIRWKQPELDVKDVVQTITDTSLYCRECGIKDVNISFILVKRNFHLTSIIWQTNDLLSEYFVSNNFHYLTNDNIVRQNLWKDGIKIKMVIKL